MRVLFIGGTGVISSACAELAVEKGFELYLLNRGKTKRPVPKKAHILLGDIRDRSSAEAALEGRTFDVVVNWVAFTPEHIKRDLELFGGRTGQYIFISSASAYQTPPEKLPVTEYTPLSNTYWEYSRNKIACEKRLFQAYRKGHFPITIVRPSHTYDCTMLPMHNKYTLVDRMRKGKKVVVHGDGTSLWVLTHHRDFAKGFVGLLSNNKAIGEAFHITSDELLSWNQIYEIIAHAAGAEARIVHIPSEFIAAFDSEWGASLLGDKSHSMIFDNSKIKRFVPDFTATIPFFTGAQEIISWYNADPSRQVVDKRESEIIDKIITRYEMALPQRKNAL
ncbi:SDR family oxidoreductase [candidate division WOR-3 bacterium]|nr:SDR family oxidoreductase [candidate division WOR-3 bacterium]